MSPSDSVNAAFDDAERHAERATWWSPGDDEKDHPAKLTLRLERWENIPSQYKPKDERQCFLGRDRDGQLWCIPCNNLDLQPLWTGEVKRWNRDRQVYEVVGNEGRAEPGEYVVFEYKGLRSFTNKDNQQVTVPSYYRPVRRKPDPAAAGSVESPEVPDHEADAIAEEVDSDDLPW